MVLRKFRETPAPRDGSWILARFSCPETYWAVVHWVPDEGNFNRGAWEFDCPRSVNPDLVPGFLVDPDCWTPFVAKT